MAQTLEQTTTFKTRIGEVAKKHENTIRVLTDEASQALFAPFSPPTSFLCIPRAWEG